VCVQLTCVAQFAGKYVKGERPWGVDAKYDIALPCATQNEVGSPAHTTPGSCLLSVLTQQRGLSGSGIRPPLPFPKHVKP
jgi:hypothetical protein